MLRLVCTGDTHGQQDQVSIPDGDIFVFAGDAAGHGGMAELHSFCSWVQRLPHRYKIVIAGNHDFEMERMGTAATTELLTADGRFPEVIYLRDNWTKVQNLKFYGSPWTPRFFNWSFMATRGAKMMEKWRKIPDYVDVLITHGPPFGRLDQPNSGMSPCGCEALANRLAAMKTPPSLHVFGHIHGGYGVSPSYSPDGGILTYYANVSCCTESYKPVNSPLVLDWDGKEFTIVLSEAS